MQLTLKDLKREAWFTLKPIEYPSENQVYIRGPYDRSEKKYLITKFMDMSDGRMLKGSTPVYTDFVF